MATPSRRPITEEAPLEPKDNAQERIAKRAYELWEQDGKVTGRDQEHWFQAEAELGRCPHASRKTKAQGRAS